jgi:hypothetical protein
MAVPFLRFLFCPFGRRRRQKWLSLGRPYLSLPFVSFLLKLKGNLLFWVTGLAFFSLVAALVLLIIRMIFVICIYTI